MDLTYFAPLRRALSAQQQDALDRILFVISKYLNRFTLRRFSYAFGALCGEVSYK
jgi:hypothetical protein